MERTDDQMNRKIIKLSRGGLIAQIIIIIVFLLVSLYTLNQESRIFSTGLAVVLMMVYTLLRFRVAVILEEERILLKGIFRTRIIELNELMDLSIRSRSVTFIKENGVRYTLNYTGFRMNDVVDMNKIFRGLIEEE